MNCLKVTRLLENTFFKKDILYQKTKKRKEKNLRCKIKNDFFVCFFCQSLHKESLLHIILHAYFNFTPADDFSFQQS